jgi:ribonuclease P protein component
MQRRHRLTESRDFQRVRGKGRSWAQPLLILLALANDLPYSRFGFLVSKRVGNAVVRNHVKRLLREAARARLAVLSPGWDVVFIARVAIVDADLRHIEQAMDTLLTRAGLIRKSPQAQDVDQ